MLFRVVKNKYLITFGVWWPSDYELRASNENLVNNTNNGASNAWSIRRCRWRKTSMYDLRK